MSTTKNGSDSKGPRPPDPGELPGEPTKPPKVLSPSGRRHLGVGSALAGESTKDPK